MYAIAKLKRNVKPFSLKLFKGDALKVYEETCQLLAEGDQSRLRQVRTPVYAHSNTVISLDNSSSVAFGGTKEMLQRCMRRLVTAC